MHHHAHHEQGDHVAHDPAIFKRKFWLCLILTIPVLLFSPTIQQWLFGSTFTIAGSEYLPALLGTVIFMYGGAVFLSGAVAELRQRRPGMMTLIAMAIIVAFLYSAVVTVGLLDGMDFWWELATLVTIMLLGHWLEMASIARAQNALYELAKLLPDEAELLVGEDIKQVSVSSLHVGDVVLVRPGARVPADGIVIKGHSDVDESMLTGESHPIKKTTRAKVVAGTINGNGSLTVRVAKIGDDTVLAGIMRLVEAAQHSKSKTQVLADRAAYYLTFVALGAALTAGVGWAIAGAAPAFILERVVTVLIIACPHALGLAIPLVTAISTTLAAKQGLLVRERKALEAARDVDVILFDKTGTLTKGEQGVVAIIAEDEAGALAVAAAVELESEHAIARAIVRAARQKQVALPTITNFAALPGRGAKARVGGKQWYIGGPALLDELKLKTEQSMAKKAAAAAQAGQTVVYLVEQQHVRAMLLLADVIRDESRAAVAALQALGKRVALLTGDSAGVAAWVAKELNIPEYFAEVLPEYKAETVRKLQAEGAKVAMVGDGVNDAPALAQADVGIAIGAGTDVAIGSAGIVLASSDPRGVAKILALSAATYQKMIQNLVWATGYNIVAIPLAMGVGASFGLMLSPAVGAVLMSLSTIIVALNAQLLRRVKI